MKKSVPFDQYQRYKNASEIVEEWKGLTGNTAAKILEVGANEHKNLQYFLETDRITYLDIELPDALLNDPAYVIGDATNMVFEDNSFDWVIALDVFEHIPTDRKKNFLNELSRVSEQGFIISAPFNSEKVQAAERRTNAFYRALYGEDYIWLKEHSDIGLPLLDETLAHLRDQDIPHVHFGHGSLHLWERMTSIHFLAAGHDELIPYRFLIDDIYNGQIYEADYSGDVYRHFIISVKDEVSLSNIQDWFSERKGRITSSDTMQIIEKGYEYLSLLHRGAIMKLHARATDETLRALIENQQSAWSQMQMASDEVSQANMKILIEKISNIEELIESSKQKDYSISELNGTIQQMDQIVRGLTEMSDAKERKIAELSEMIHNKDSYIAELQAMANSLRIVNRVKRMIPRQLRRRVKEAWRVGKLIKNNPHYINRGIQEYKARGFSGLKERVKGAELQQLANASTNEVDETVITQSDIERLMYQPFISIIMPVYNVDAKWLDKAIQSVKRQVYPKWELCIVDDCSTKEETLRYLRSLNHPQIKIEFSTINLNISGASNKAAALASGEYFTLLDNDDALMPNALYEVVAALQDERFDLLYSDEDKIDSEGNRKTPLYKPDWSPDLLRSQMYLGHLLVFRRELFERVGGFRVGYDGAQDYDLVLRMTEIPGCRITHISKILYSWREIPSSTASNPHSKPYAHTAGLKAVNEHLERVYGTGNAWAEETDYLFVYDVRYKLTSSQPKVSIIIPTKDKIDLLEPCIESIIRMTEYLDYEILVLNNNSEEEMTRVWFERVTQQYERVRVIDAAYPFNWSKLNNHGIREATGDVFVFLNNDTLVINSDWLLRLAEKAVKPDVGTVGALLLFEDGSIQHAGVVIGMGGWADHVFKGLPPVHYGSPFISPMVTRNVSSSTGACLAISRQTVEIIGGFDEEFIICGSDVEISLRAMKYGLFNIYDPNVRLIHYESKTRTPNVPEKDFEMSALHYGPYLRDGDPYYNMNLSLQHLIPTRK